jgi:hypothetical protein
MRDQPGRGAGKYSEAGEEMEGRTRVWIDGEPFDVEEVPGGWRHYRPTEGPMSADRETPEAVIECEARPLLPPTISLTQCPICGCRDWWRAGEDLVDSLVWLNGGLCCVLCHCLVSCVAVVEET